MRCGYCSPGPMFSTTRVYVYLVKAIQQWGVNNLVGRLMIQVGLSELVVGRFLFLEEEGESELQTHTCSRRREIVRGSEGDTEELADGGCLAERGASKEPSARLSLSWSCLLCFRDRWETRRGCSTLYNRLFSRFRVPSGPVKDDGCSGASCTIVLVLTCFGSSV